MINQTFNMFNSSKTTKDLLKKKDLLLVGSFIRVYGVDVIHISKNEQLDRYRERLSNSSFSVFADKDVNNIVLLDGLGVSCKEVIKIFCVPKLTKFMNRFNDNIEKNQSTIESFIEEFEKSYHFDLNKITNNIIGKKNKVGKSFYEITYLDSIRFKIDKNTDKLSHVEVKFTPMLLNFIEQTSLTKTNLDITLFSTEVCDMLMEDTGDDYEVVEEYIQESSKILSSILRLDKNESVMLVAKNSDWQNRTGYKTIDVERSSDIIKGLIPEYDNTTIIKYNYDTYEPYAIIYSHDCPTGSYIDFIQGRYIDEEI